MSLPTCLMPWQGWLEGSTQLGLSSRPPTRGLYYSGLGEIRLLTWRLMSPKVSAPGTKAEIMFYDLTPEDLASNFHNIP